MSFSVGTINIFIYLLVIDYDNKNYTFKVPTFFGGGESVLD